MKNTTYLILVFLVCQFSFSKVTVDPVMPALSNMVVCDDNTDGMALFNVSTQDAYILSGQSLPSSSYVVSYHLTLSGANSGTAAIASPASYLGSNGQVIYARIINIATGSFAVGSFSLIVNPKPAISNKVVTICSGNTFNVTPTNTLPDVVPVGTTYTWTVTPPVTIVGASNQSVPQTSITQTLTNSSNFVQDVVYHVTATSNTCSSIFTITVTVNPKPTIASKSVSICNGGTFNVTPINAGLEIVPVGTIYTCTAPVYSSPNISGGSALVVGQTEISQTLINSGSTVETATYTVTAISGAVLPNSCSSVFTITVTVNPSIIQPFPNVQTCGFYTLPPLSVGNYYTGPNGTGIMIPAGTVITTTQMIYVHATNGSCTTDQSFSVTVINPPNVIITGTGNSNSVYVDYPTETVVQPLLLTATIDFPANYSYQWFLNGMAIAGATNSTFLVNTFELTNNSRIFSVMVTFMGCSGMSSNFVVTQAAVPTPSGLANQTFTPGQTLANLVVVGTNILWYSSLTNKNATATPLPLNTLIVDGTTYYASQTMNGYESPARFAVTAHAALSNDSFGVIDFKYSPNPVNDYLFIQAKETIKTVAVYNATGQLVWSQHGNSIEVKLDLTLLKSGNYFVKIQSDLKQNSFKIIKK